MPPTFVVKVGHQSSVQFINNTASGVGRTVYAKTQPAVPCLFMVTDYSAQISFIGNYANCSVGHHMYGTSIRADKCDREHMEQANERGIPYCWHKHERSQHKRIKISFDPGLKRILSPVSSAPWHVCLCDSNGIDHSVLTFHIFSLISTSIMVKPSHYLLM